MNILSYSLLIYFSTHVVLNSCWESLGCPVGKLLTADSNYIHFSVSPRYLINFLLDASLGMLLIYAGVRAVSAIVEWRQWDSLRFGEYGEDRASSPPLFFHNLKIAPPSP